jgi:hypothetical protein
MNGSDRIGKWKDLYKLYLSSPLCGKSLGMNMLETCDLIGEIVSLSKKAYFYLFIYYFIFFTTAQRKYFVMNEQDIEELSIHKSIIFDTGLFHIKRESFVTIEAEVMWIIQESKSICFVKRKYQ